MSVNQNTPRQKAHNHTFETNTPAAGETPLYTPHNSARCRHRLAANHYKTSHTDACSELDTAAMGVPPYLVAPSTSTAIPTPGPGLTRPCPAPVGPSAPQHTTATHLVAKGRHEQTGSIQPWLVPRMNRRTGRWNNQVRPLIRIHVCRCTPTNSPILLTTTGIMRLLPLLPHPAATT